MKLLKNNRLRNCQIRTGYVSTRLIHRLRDYQSLQRVYLYTFLPVYVIMNTFSSTVLESPSLSMRFTSSAPKK